jgi:CheY-like chemotaxis protein
LIAKKILLAEDDMDDQKIFQEFLAHRTDIDLLPPAENGDEVFRLIEGGHVPDIIILDQNMPKRNGLQTLQLLKETSAYTHIPVIIYSTYADGNLVQRSTDLGAAGVWSKPITQEGYNEMIDALLKMEA